MSSTDLAIGFAAAGVASFFFGTNFLPIKKYETGDGMFFQWILCTAIFISGTIVQLSMGSPPFQPFAMLGGFLWATGNVMVVPIIKTIGLALGICIWGVSNLIFGWLSGKFIFDETGSLLILSRYISVPYLNYIGAFIAIFSVITFASIQAETSNTDQQVDLAINEEKKKLLDQNSNEEVDWTKKLSTTNRRIIGILFSVISGFFYGVNFDPPQYLMIKQKNDQALDYVFSHFTGIFCTSTFYLLIYCIIKKNKPQVFPEVIFPGFISGLLWSIADISWFIANEKLKFVVSFPIVTTGPSIFASLWGIILYKEIKGKKNFIKLGFAFLLTFTGITLITLSKVL